MADIRAPKRARRAIGMVRDACRNEFATSFGFDQHQKRGYLCGTPCYAVDDGSTRIQKGGQRTGDDVDGHAANAEAT